MVGADVLTGGHETTRLWLGMGRLYEALEGLGEVVGYEGVREQARARIYEVAGLQDVDPVVRGLILRTLELVESAPSREPGLLRELAGAVCLCRQLRRPSGLLPGLFSEGPGR
jgi:hypothetical protein